MGGTGATDGLALGTALVGRKVGTLEGALVTGAKEGLMVVGERVGANCRNTLRTSSYALGT